MQLKNKLIPSIMALVIILGAGYVHGITSFRWTAESALKVAEANLSKIPLEIEAGVDGAGNKIYWKGLESKLDERQMKIGQIRASVSRRYTNSQTGQSVTILLLTGRPGPMSVHTPEVCYAGSGYTKQTERKLETIPNSGGSPANFWSLRVGKEDPLQPGELNILYGWFAKSKWTAPETDARFSFAEFPVLYKLYTVREDTRTTSGRSGDASDPSVKFLEVFLPVLQNILGDAV
jgi:hypothetical protein